MVCCVGLMQDLLPAGWAGQRQVAFPMTSPTLAVRLAQLGVPAHPGQGLSSQRPVVIIPMNVPTISSATDVINGAMVEGLRTVLLIRYLSGCVENLDHPVEQILLRMSCLGAGAKAGVAGVEFYNSVMHHAPLSEVAEKITLYLSELTQVRLLLAIMFSNGQNLKNPEWLKASQIDYEVSLALHNAARAWNSQDLSRKVLYGTMAAVDCGLAMTVNMQK